jgi:hypothetical protein
METIYSRIIWKELGMKDYKIHEEPFEKTDGLIIDWVKNNSIEKVNEVLFDISWIDTITNSGYYDGQFYGINQREKDKQYKHEDGKPQPDLILHDTSMFTSILHLSIKTRLSPDELIFMAKILEVYYEKLPKQTTCSINETEEGEEF